MPDPFAAPASNSMPSPWFTLAAGGAFLASAYWLGLTVFLGMGSASGTVSPVRMVLPVILIAGYAWRGVQVARGEAPAARSLMMLHGVGALVSLLNLAAGGTLLLVLYGIKVAIHAFGGVCAAMAARVT